MKLHAVAPGGPPEGQCIKKQEMVLDAKLDDPLSASHERLTFPE